MRNKHSFIWVTLATVGIAGLSACAPQPDGVRETVHPYSTSKNPEEIYQAFVGKTLHFSDKNHGTQIEYHAPDGRAYLWYPGNKRAVSGFWEIRPPRKERQWPELCYKYPRTSFNPLTKEFGGKWECRLSVASTIEVRSAVAGDPFNLQSGRVPVVLPKGKIMSLGEVTEIAPGEETLQYLYKSKRR